MALDSTILSTHDDGPVDAAYKAVEKIPKVSARREDYTVRTVTGGQAAMGEVTVQMHSEDHQVTGQAVTTNEESE